MNEALALLLLSLLMAASYGVGRLHSNLGWRQGYRFGYRQGYLDGDRASWSRRRRDLQAAVASVLSVPTAARRVVYPGGGTTYTSSARTSAAEWAPRTVDRGTPTAARSAP